MEENCGMVTCAALEVIDNVSTTTKPQNEAGSYRDQCADFISYFSESNYGLLPSQYSM
jgi:hypothetical protein